MMEQRDTLMYLHPRSTERHRTQCLGEQLILGELLVADVVLRPLGPPAVPRQLPHQVVLQQERCTNQPGWVVPGGQGSHQPPRAASCGGRTHPAMLSRACLFGLSLKEPWQNTALPLI